MTLDLESLHIGCQGQYHHAVVSILVIFIHIVLHYVLPIFQEGLVYKLDNLILTEIDCGVPEPSSGANYGSPRDTSYNSNFAFECEENFHLAGKSSFGDNSVRCTDDAIWDFGDLKCEGPVCQDPGQPPDGVQKAISYEQGSEVNFGCTKPGYIPIIDAPIKCVRSE